MLYNIHIFDQFCESLYIFALTNKHDMEFNDTNLDELRQIIRAEAREAMLECGAPRLIERTEAIAQIGRSRLERLIRSKQLKPVRKSPGKNAKMYFDRREFLKAKNKYLN